jgi:hypothetical protein
MKTNITRSKGNSVSTPKQILNIVVHAVRSVQMDKYAAMESANCALLFKVTTSTVDPVVMSVGQTSSVAMECAKLHLILLLIL